MRILLFVGLLLASPAHAEMQCGPTWKVRTALQKSTMVSRTIVSVPNGFALERWVNDKTRDWVDVLWYGKQACVITGGKSA